MFILIDRRQKPWNCHMPVSEAIVTVQDFILLLRFEPDSVPAQTFLVAPCFIFERFGEGLQSTSMCPVSFRIDSTMKHPPCALICHRPLTAAIFRFALLNRTGAGRSIEGSAVGFTFGSFISNRIDAAISSSFASSLSLLSFSRDLCSSNWQLQTVPQMHFNVQAPEPSLPKLACPRVVVA